jgi:hypothetical protein
MKTHLVLCKVKEVVFTSPWTASLLLDFEEITVFMII